MILKCSALPQLHLKLSLKLKLKLDIRQRQDQEVQLQKYLDDTISTYED